MCFFGKKPKMPKPVAPPTLQIPEQKPIEEQLPQTQSGADQAAATQKPKKKSLFEIDLTIGTGANSQGGSATGAANAADGQTGPATR